MAFVRCIESSRERSRNSYSGLLACIEHSGGQVLGEAVLQNSLDTRHHTDDFTSSRTYCHPVPERVLSGHVAADADFSCDKAALLRDMQTRTNW
jgi:hypothetical protein